MAVSTVSYRAEIKDLRVKLASITDVTRAEARKMVSELNRSMRAVERSNQRAAKAAQAFGAGASSAATSANKLAQAGQSVAMQLPDVASQLASGTPPAQVFAQQGLQVVQQNMTSLMGVMARFGPHAAAVALAVGLMGAAYLELSDQLEKAESAMRAASAAAAAAQTSHANFEKAIGDINTALEHATSGYDALDRAQAKRDAALLKAAEAQRKQARAALDQAEADHKANLEALESARTAMMRNLANHKLEKSTAAVTAASALYERQLEAINAKEAEALVRSAQVKTATEQRKAAEKALEEQQRARAAAQREAEAQARKAEAEALRMLHERQRAAEQLGAVERNATLANLDGVARVNFLYVERMQQIAELERLSGDHAAANEARAAVDEQRQAELWEARQARLKKAQDKADAAHREQLKRDKTEADKKLRYQREIEAGQRALSDAMMSFSSTAADAMLAHANEVAETNRSAALDVFKAYKAISIVSALVSGAAGAARALAEYPWPYSLAVAGLVAAETAIHVATIANAQPSFADTPGIQRAGDRGMTASFAPGDLVMAGRTGDDLVRQMQRAGLGGGGSEVMVRDADRHRGRYGRDPLRAPERYTSLRRRAGRTPGRR